MIAACVFMFICGKPQIMGQYTPATYVLDPTLRSTTRCYTGVVIHSPSSSVECLARARGPGG